MSCHGNFCDENASRVGQIQKLVHTECTCWKGFGGVSRWIPQKKNRALPGISHTQALCMYQHPTSNEGSSDQSQTQT